MELHYIFTELAENFDRTSVITKNIDRLITMIMGHYYNCDYIYGTVQMFDYKYMVLCSRLQMIADTIEYTVLEIC